MAAARNEFGELDLLRSHISVREKATKMCLTEWRARFANRHLENEVHWEGRHFPHLPHGQGCVGVFEQTQTPRARENYSREIL
jgi:hypothetical protein